MMNLTDIKKRCNELMRDREFYLERETGSALFHGERVAKLSIALRKQIIPDDSSHDDVLEIAGWFHDIGKGIEPHAEYGALIAREALRDFCNSYELNEVISLIKFHCDRNSTEILHPDWIKVFQDADLLDHFGSVSIWTDFHYFAHKKISLMDAIESHEKHFEENCNNYFLLLNYETSRNIALERIDFVKKFYTRLKIEGEGNINFKEKPKFTSS